MISHFILKSTVDFASKGKGRPLAARTTAADDRNLEAAVTWLMRSIEACDGHASSKGYRFLKGWMPPYPETSGYIIPTLLALADSRGDQIYAEKANRIADWLCTIQMSHGGFVGREIGVQDEADVFDTGMILLGLNALISMPGNDHLIDCGRKAANFLTASMDTSGCFVRNMSHDMVHTYNVRAAWGLLAFAELVDDDELRQAALRNVQWTLRQQLPNGFFLNNAFKPGGNANLHGTAYVMRALLQAHELTGDPAQLEAVSRAADSLVQVFARNDWIASELGSDWNFGSSHICLTGYAQLAIVLLRLSVLLERDDYAQTAEQLIDDVAISQDTTSRNAPYYGGIAGSYPIYGAYAPLQYPNWATKFFIDALLLRDRIKSGNAEPLRFQFYGG